MPTLFIGKKLILYRHFLKLHNRYYHIKRYTWLFRPRGGVFGCGARIHSLFCSAFCHRTGKTPFFPRAFWGELSGCWIMLILTLIPIQDQNYKGSVLKIGKISTSDKLQTFKTIFGISCKLLNIMRKYFLFYFQMQQLQLLRGTFIKRNHTTFQENKNKNQWF